MKKETAKGNTIRKKENKKLIESEWKKNEQKIKKRKLTEKNESNEDLIKESKRKKNGKR